MTVEKLEVLKVKLENEYYVLIVPNKDECDDKFWDLFMMNELMEHTMWILSVAGLSEADVVEIVEQNAADYIDWYREEFGV